MPSSSAGVTVGELAQICSALTASHPEIDREFEQDTCSALVRMTFAEHPSRRATVSASISGWIEMSIDGGYGIVQIDEDASSDEFRAYMQDYVGLGINYLHHGAQERRSRFLRVPMQVLDPNRGWRGIVQLTSPDQFRYAWRRLWARDTKRGDVRDTSVSDGF